MNQIRRSFKIGDGMWSRFAQKEIERGGRGSGETYVQEK